MSGRDEWVEKQLAREAKGRAKAEAMLSHADMLTLVRDVCEKACRYSDVAKRWAAVGDVDMSLAAGARAAFAFKLANDVQGSFAMGRHISLKARLEEARSFLTDEYWDKRLAENLKALTRKEKTLERKAAR